MTTAIQLENLLLAAQQGNVQAQNQLGLFYLTGESLSQNLDRAWYWFNEAAKRGLEEARLNLGKMYREGQVKDFTDDMSQATTPVAKALYECRRAALRELNYFPSQAFTNKLRNWSFTNAFFKTQFFKLKRLRLLWPKRVLDSMLSRSPKHVLDIFSGNWVKLSDDFYL